MNDNTSLGSPFVGGRKKQRSHKQRSHKQRSHKQRSHKQRSHKQRSHMQRKRTQRQRKQRQTRNKNGGMWSNVINQAVVPFSILAMQQKFRKGKKNNSRRNKTMKSRR